VIVDGEIYDKCLIANAPEAKMFANMEDNIGLMHPPMLGSAEISTLKTKSITAGFLDEIKQSGQYCTVVSWGVLPNGDRPADCVVLSYNEPGKGEVAFRIADEIQERIDVAFFLRNRSLTACGWICHFDRSILPPGDHLLRGWAFDAKKAILYPLDTPKTLH
jgi:hypothetical protein